MKGLRNSAAAVAAVALMCLYNHGSRHRLIADANAAPEIAAACMFPTSPSSTPEETAWRIFVAANCPSNRNKVVWEDWIEQLQLYPASGRAAGHRRTTVKRLHGSPLAQAEIARAHRLHSSLVPITECTKIQPPNAPPNLTAGATVCEEARLNPEAEQFVITHGFHLRPGQTSAAQQALDIEFPKPAIEVKVDWLPAADFSPAFTCDNPPQGVHLETIDGTCYAMAGIHLSSKLLSNWLWATFEPQSMLTNPLRCVTFGACNDPWGSTPATSNGGSNGLTLQSRVLADLMKQANLAPEFFNYRLDGVQVNFTNADGTPTFLGNSIIEGENAGLKRNEASCITCHSVSSIKKDGSDGFNTFINLPNPPVGSQHKVPVDWIARDFVWSMAFACPDPTRTGEQPCTTHLKTAAR